MKYDMEITDNPDELWHEGKWFIAQKFDTGEEAILELKKIETSLEDHENWDAFITATAKIFDVEEIDWKDGKYDFMEWFGKLKKDKEMIKKIKQLNIELLDGKIGQNQFALAVSRLFD